MTLFAAIFQRPGAAKKWPGVSTEPKDLNMASVIRIPEKNQPADWLRQMIEQSNTPRTVTTDLTPDLAKALLSLNSSNRPIRQVKVSQYARDMAAGRWALNGEPIIVATGGHLNDGQHRCIANIDANTAVPVFITFGIDRDTRLTVDQGGARTAGDILGMEGVQNGSLVAAIARMVIAYEQGDQRGLADAKRITSAQIRERAYTDTALGASATFGCTQAKYSATFVSGSVVGFVHYCLAKINTAEAESFLTSVCRGENLRIGQPAHTLREKLISGGKLSRERKIKLIFQAWNFHRRGMKVRASSMDSTMPLPALI